VSETFTSVSYATKIPELKT